MLIMFKTCRASDVISTLDLVRITLLHALKSTAETPMARLCSSHFDEDRKLLRLQGYEQRSFIESIGGEESPSANDCITLHDQYDLDLYL